MQLFVDGQLQAQRADVTKGQDVLGYWRIGGDSLSRWSARPTSAYLAGDIDEVAIYPSVLSAAQVKNHYGAGSTGTPANAAPTASFTAQASNLDVALDASASKDPDGSITDYAWDFGDGATGSGASATHSYAQAGTYTVKLTVTDNGGLSQSTTQDVTVAAANQDPVASFTAQASGLDVALDASGSADPDGSITDYAWDFGDGATGSGASATHSYAQAGSYTVKLTVTDNRGATASATRTVEVAAPAPANVAADAFGRTLASGWGSADTGGAWTLRGSSSNFSVADGAGRIRMNTPGAGPGASLASVSAAGTDTSVRFSLDKPATGGGIYVDVIGRRVGTTGQYFATARVTSTGAVVLQAQRAVGSTETVLRQSTISGLTYAAGQQLQVRLQVTGTAPTTVRAKIWPAGTDEPADWQVSATDSTAGLQVPGAVGLGVYASASATNTPVFASFDDLVVKPAD
jgi:PKD repeat protein